MVLILSRPAEAPPVPVEAFAPMSHVWVTPSGRQFDLNDWRGGLMLDNRGVEGLHFPKIVKHASTSRAFHGKRLRGWRAEARQVFWPVHLWGESSAEFLARYEAFFGELHPQNEGIWRVGANGTYRELRVTGTFDQPHVYELDPAQEGWATYSVTMEAVQPFWAGKPVKAGPWRAASSVNFIDAAGSPPFHISRGSTFESAQIENPGDVDAWPVWTLEGPLDPISVGVGGRQIVVPFPLLTGQKLRIDTDPRNVTAIRDGADVTRQMGFQPFAPVPAKQTVPLHVSTVGAGSVQVELVPLHFRAF